MSNVFQAVLCSARHTCVRDQRDLRYCVRAVEVV